MEKKEKCKEEEKKKKKKNIPNNIQCKSKRIKCDPKWDSIMNDCQYAFNEFADSNEYTDAGRLKYRNPCEFLLEKFDPTDLPEDGKLSILVFGKRRTGKSFFTKWYLSERREDFDELFVFTKTKCNGWYQKFLPEPFIYDGYQADKAEQILNHAKDMQEKEMDGKGPEPRIFFLGDDLISDHSHRHDETLDALYTMGRHVGITVAYLSQKFKAVTPAIRDNADIIVIFTMFNANEAQQIAEEMMGNINKRTAMELIAMYANAQQHTCLVIEAWRNEMDPEKYIKIARADEVDLQPGDLGSEEYWETARQLQLENKLRAEAARAQRSGNGTRDAMRQLFGR